MPDDVPERIREIRERVEAATEGPWKLWNGWGPLERDGRHRVQRIAPTAYTEDRISAPGGDIAGRKEDLEFVAKSRSDVPYLLSLVEELREENRELRSVAARAHAYLVQDRDWEGATSILSEGPGVESLSLDIEELDVSPANRSEVSAALRDAAQEGAE